MPKKPKPKKLHGLSTFTQAVADQICKRLATGETLRSICRTEGIPPESTVRQWALQDTGGFYAQYAQARDLGLDCMADQLFDITDQPLIGEKTRERGGKVEIETGDNVDRARLMVDTRKWYLSKLAPKRYGEKLHLAGADGGAIEIKRVVGVTDETV